MFQGRTTGWASRPVQVFYEMTRKGIQARAENPALVPGACPAIHAYPEAAGTGYGKLTGDVCRIIPALVFEDTDADAILARREAFAILPICYAGNDWMRQMPFSDLHKVRAESIRIVFSGHGFSALKPVLFLNKLSLI